MATGIPKRAATTIRGYRRFPRICPSPARTTAVILHWVGSGTSESGVEAVTEAGSASLPKVAGAAQPVFLWCRLRAIGSV